MERRTPHQIRRLAERYGARLQEIVDDTGLDADDAKKVKEVMDDHRLDQEIAVELKDEL